MSWPNQIQAPFQLQFHQTRKFADLNKFFLPCDIFRLSNFVVLQQILDRFKKNIGDQLPAFDNTRNYLLREKVYIKFLFWVVPLTKAPKQVNYTLLIKENLQDQRNMAWVFVAEQTLLLILNGFVLKMTVDFWKFNYCL